MLNQQNTEKIFRLLDKKYPHPKAPLKHKSAFQLLIAIILSTQCTDQRVNQITPKLFKIAPTPEKMLKLGEEKLKKIIFSCGFYNAKSKNIMGMSKKLLKDFGGKMPDTLDNLKKLPGVATKSASVLLSQWYNTPAFPVDTHVFRLANRIGIVRAGTPEKTYRALIKKVPEKYWKNGSLQLVFHGRETCTARKPKCKQCILKNICQYKYKPL